MYIVAAGVSASDSREINFMHLVDGLLKSNFREKSSNVGMPSIVFPLPLDSLVGDGNLSFCNADVRQWGSQSAT